VSDVAATVRTHDVDTRTGSVLLDDGTLLPYSCAAFDASGLRLLRSGQRVHLRLDESSAVIAITLPTFDLPRP
jgi:2-phospho-L-lactate guanylyltransferase